MPDVKPKINRIRAEDYKVIFATGFSGGFQPDHFEIIPQTASLNANESQQEGKPVADFVDNLCIKITPVQAKLMVNWLSDNIKNYEKQFGEIKIGKEIKQKMDKAVGMYG